MPKRVEIDDQVLAAVESRCPRYLTTTAFINLLLDQALDSSGTLGLAEEPKASPSSSSSYSSIKKNTKKEINQCLEQHEELIREFWAAKGGSRGDTAWKLLMTELSKLHDAYGPAVVAEQLQLAINGKWQGISLARYEQFKAPRGGAPAQPEHKHPAARDFTAERIARERAEQDRLETIPSATGGRGVLEGLF